jgi:hypothetical protein
MFTSVLEQPVDHLTVHFIFALHRLQSTFLNREHLDQLIPINKFLVLIMSILPSIET